MKPQRLRAMSSNPRVHRILNNKICLSNCANSRDSIKISTNTNTLTLNYSIAHAGNPLPNTSIQLKARSRDLLILSGGHSVATRGWWEHVVFLCFDWLQCAWERDACPLRFPSFQPIGVEFLTGASALVTPRMLKRNCTGVLLLECDLRGSNHENRPVYRDNSFVTNHLFHINKCFLHTLLNSMMKTDALKLWN